MYFRVKLWSKGLQKFTVEQFKKNPELFTCPCNLSVLSPFKSIIQSSLSSITVKSDCSFLQE